MSTLTDEIALRIKAELTQELWNRLLVYADYLVENHIWHGILGGAPVRGFEADDFLQNALIKAVRGKRAWNPENCSLEKFLMGVLKSDINHASEWPENIKTVREGSLDSEEEDSHTAPLDRFKANVPSVDEAECEKEYNDTILEFLDSLSDDPPVQKMFELIYDGIVKRAEHAKAMDLPENQVDVIKKRLNTRVRTFAEKRRQNSKEVHHV